MKFNNRNVYISPKAIIGNNVKIGDNTSIYDNVSIGDNSIISNDCIIGEPAQDYYFNSNYENPETKIEQGALIRSHTIIYSNTYFQENFSTGHRVTIREGTHFGTNCRVGTLSDIQGDAVFGNYCWLHSNVHIGRASRIGNFVFIYPFVVITNDPTPPSNLCIGAKIDDFAVIAVHSIILPGVEIGKHALVGAGSVVGKDVEPYQLVLGDPAKQIKDIREIKSREKGSKHYPWPYTFSRGMPWAIEGFEAWQKNQVL